MNSLFHKITSVFLTIVLLFSITVYSISSHLCSESIYSVSLFGNAEDCGMEMENCENEQKNSSSISKEKCCSDITIVVETDTFNKVSDITINTNLLFITAFIITSQNLYESLNNSIKDYTNYYPPLINKDIIVLYEVFLI